MVDVVAWFKSNRSCQQKIHRCAASIRLLQPNRRSGDDSRSAPASGTDVSRGADAWSQWQELRVDQQQIDRRRLLIARLVDLGRELFRTDFTVEQGLGNGLARKNSKLAGSRPAPNLRHVHGGEFGGPDATRCAACHHVGGLGGGGGKIDTVFLSAMATVRTWHCIAIPKRCSARVFYKRWPRK